MKTKTIAFGLVTMLALGLTACSSAPKTGDQNAAATSSQAGEAPAPDSVAGFTEYPIGDPLSLPPLEVAAVYFQPVDMEPGGMGLAAADADMHLEADISAGQNDLGYGVGDFVPNLTVEYSITAADGKIAAEGTFMPMNASDGPHYGANVALPDAGTYKVAFTITPPDKNGHVLHVDPETGVEGRYWTTPIVAEWDFQYTPREW